jgi:hypothetical protein
MIPQFNQNKINGISIAWGRANWDYEDSCYVFPNEDSYRVTVSDQVLMDAGISEDDLLDCVSQVGDELGSPLDYRKELGLVKYSGYSNIGTVVRSRTYPAISCVFTPTSTEDGMPDAYFEWYLDTSHPSITDLSSFLQSFNNAADVRLPNVAVSPVMPSYMEAQEFFNRNRNKFNDEDRFLAEVWKYHQTQNKGFKRRLGEELLPQWVNFIERSQSK